MRAVVHAQGYLGLLAIAAEVPSPIKTPTETLCEASIGVGPGALTGGGSVARQVGCIICFTVTFHVEHWRTQRAVLFHRNVSR
jgi:hypothetical protein